MPVQNQDKPALPNLAPVASAHVEVPVTKTPLCKKEPPDAMDFFIWLIVGSLLVAIGYRFGRHDSSK